MDLANELLMTSIRQSHHIHRKLHIFQGKNALNRMIMTDFLLSCPRMFVYPLDSQSMLELEILDCNIGSEVISFRHSILLLSVTLNIKVLSCHEDT